MKNTLAALAALSVLATAGIALAAHPQVVSDQYRLRATAANVEAQAQIMLSAAGYQRFQRTWRYRGLYGGRALAQLRAVRAAAGSIHALRNSARVLKTLALSESSSSVHSAFLQVVASYRAAQQSLARVRFFPSFRARVVSLETSVRAMRPVVQRLMAAAYQPYVPPTSGPNGPHYGHERWPAPTLYPRTYSGYYPGASAPSNHDSWF